ncbi:undecaprenyl-phosphate glucose phosphotransferase [Pseudoxanthobacter sp.]|uniref:undecaprenyl-phosphate glucose phosphotransferase n=1 Tax=Pseudoxanthobacter sp. TaxID=1925742 RepID=UPI002FDFC0A2
MVTEPYSRTAPHGRTAAHRVHLPLDTVRISLAVLDFAVMVLSSVLGNGLYLHFIGDDVMAGSRLTELASAGIIGGLIFVFVAHANGGYNIAPILRRGSQLSLVVRGVLAAVLFYLCLLFLVKVSDTMSRGGLIAFTAVAIGLVFLERSLVARSILRLFIAGYILGPRTVVLGEPRELAALSGRRVLLRSGLNEVARFEFSTPFNAPMRAVADAAVVADVVACVQQHGADQVLLAMSWAHEERLAWLREQLRILPIPVQLMPDAALHRITRDCPRVTIGQSTAYELQREPLTRFERAQKRALDVLLSAMAIAFLSPVLLACALAVRLSSPGPVIFRQRRSGFGGRKFAIYKFRSMTVMEDGHKVTQATRNDKRITAVGRVLRATSLDELPQLFNVLFGSMSLVGPRPHALAHDDEFSQFISNYAFRHHVKPGITGWAQCHGLRGETRTRDQIERRVQYDLWYIDNWSIWLDIWVLFATVLVVLKRSNAY